MLTAGFAQWLEETQGRDRIFFTSFESGASLSRVVICQVATVDSNAFIIPLTINFQDFEYAIKYYSRFNISRTLLRLCRFVSFERCIRNSINS